MTRPGAVLLARRDSSRLPGKQLRLFHGRPLLDWLLDRLGPLRDALPLIVATTDREVDDPLAAFAEQRGLRCFRGSLDDVAGRALAAADAHGLTHFFRLNGDSPFIAPELLRAALVAPESDLVTNLRPQRTWPYGVACELVRADALRELLATTNDPRHREHVTLGFYETPDRWRIHALPPRTPPLDHLRLTVDTPEDAAQIERLLSRAGDGWATWSLEQFAAHV